MMDENTMDNKENIANKYKRHPSRIPQPKDPLPALPKHLLRKNERSPLKTVFHFNVPASRSNENKKPKPDVKIQLKNVTERKTEPLDWDYSVFRDDVENQAPVDLNARLKEDDVIAVTPHLHPENKCLRNVKRSLKRPHSRELQGISTAQGKKVDLKKPKRSKFNETLQERLQAPDFWKQSYMQSLSTDYVDDILPYLLSTEKTPVAVPRHSNNTRACVMNWIMRVNGPAGNPAILQAACWYFDSILGITDVQLSKLQMVAAACYWIAQKQLGPVLLAKALVEFSDYAFTSEMLLKSEKIVLQKLKFPLQPVVPQEFITYLSWVCDQDNPGEIEVTATFFCLSGLLADKELTKEYPSVIASASVMNALLVLEKQELVGKLRESVVYKAATKKSLSIAFVGYTLRRGVISLSDPQNQYNAPLEHYDIPPHCIARKVMKRIQKMSMLEKPKDTQKPSSF